jgi:prepilin-type N-terminal cleavage/methylation domain-containing protein
MSPRSHKATGAGFTLIEVLVVIAALGMILVMVGQLLFPMRRAADRQRFQVEARQTGRSAADYVAFMVRGATDLNDALLPRNPAGLITYLWRGDGSMVTVTDPFATCPGDGGCVQLAFNNVDRAASGAIASQGSDIITLARPITTLKAVSASWPGSGCPAGGDTYANLCVQQWVFQEGCVAPMDPASGNWAGGDADNRTLFKQMTGGDINATSSRNLILYNADNGLWLVYRITDYRDDLNQDSCTNAATRNCLVANSTLPVPCLQVQASPEDVNTLNPPGAQRELTGTFNLVLGHQFVALRVCNGWLEQKNDIFDPAADANCPDLPAGTVEFPPYQAKAGWFPLLGNVEDMQVAYIFRDGTFGNGPGSTMTTADHVPGTIGISGFNATDSTNVVALRITITARSSLPAFGEGKLPLGPSAAEDRAASATTDKYFRYQVTQSVLLRSRVGGW